MRHWLTILFISLTLGLSGQNPRQSITWLRAEDITNTRYFIWRGDTIDFTRFVDSLYVSITDTALFLATKNWVINNTVMMGDSINVYITPKQLRDSLGTLPGGHNPVTISQQGLNNGLSINNDQILTIRAASTSQSGALTSNDYNIFNNKLNAVTHDNTLTGTGTVANPLKVDTSRIASKSWVLNFKFLTQEYRDYDSLYNTPFIPEIKNDPFGVDWQNDVDNGASRNAIYNAITGLGGGGGATNLSYSAYTDKGIVNSDTGTDAEIPAGSTVNASLMLPEDKEFLDTVEDSITAHRIKINSLKLVNIDSSGFRITKNQITDLTVGSSKWDDDTYGITYTGNVGIGGASSAAEKLRVTHNSTNFAVDVYNSSSTGKGLQVRAGGTNHSILDLKNYTGTSRFSFSSNGKAKFSSYGQGNITGTVSKYLAVDSSGNIIEADGTDGGGSSQWTDQTYGIAYTAGNVGIGENPLTSAFLVRKSISGGSHMGVFDNTHSSQGHGLLVQLNHTSPSYNVLQIGSRQGAHLLTVQANGDIRLQKYGKGSVTGTATKYLAVDTDGYLIEENIPQGGDGGTVTSVLAGNGMNFSTITGSGNVTLGTPSSITLSSTNSVTATSHTHKFDPGGTSSQYIRGDGTLATMPQGGDGAMTVEDERKLGQAYEYGKFQISKAFSPAVIRNGEGNNLLPTSETSQIQVVAVSGNTLTLNFIPRNLMSENVDWYLANLDPSRQNYPNPNYSGDYLTQSKVVSINWDANKVTLVSGSNFSVGHAVMFYSPFVNYEFLDGQTSAPLIGSSSGTFRDKYAAPGPVWWDDINERYILIVNGQNLSSKYQVGWAYSTDLLNWTMGNSDQPVIKLTDKSDFANNVFSSGNAMELSNGNIAFFLTGYNSSNDKSIYYCEVSKDMSNVSIGTSKIISRTDLMTPSVAFWNGKYHMIVHRRAAPLENSTIEHWSSSSLSSGWTKVSEFGAEWSDNNSIWLESHVDNFMMFAENGNLYSLTAGTTRYVESGVRGKRTFGLLQYDKETDKWNPVNSFAPEIIPPLYFHVMGEPYGNWAGGHSGGMPSFIKKDGECIVFMSFLLTGGTYGIGAIRLKDNSQNFTQSVNFKNLQVSTLTGTTPNYDQNRNYNAKITLSGNTTITMPAWLKAGDTGNITVTNAVTAYTVKFSGYTVKISPFLNSSSGAITMSGSSKIDVLSWWYDGTYLIINGTLGYD